MDEKGTSQPQQAGRIKDARGRKVTQLDPVAIYLLRQHDVIEADVAPAIAHEQGVRIAEKEPVSLIFGFVAVFTVAGLFVQSLIVGDFGKCLKCGYKFVGKRPEPPNFDECARCGYNLKGNVSGPCPECGWKLPRRRRAYRRIADRAMRAD